MSDDNKVKILKIKYALLKALSEKKAEATNDEMRAEIENKIKKVLVEFKELVTSIDAGIYLELKDKISVFQPHKKRLEDELVALADIEIFYNQLIEVQTKFKEKYKEYSEEELKLSSIDELNVEYYLKRKEAIIGYLSNMKNSEETKNRLTETNNKLYEEEQKKIRVNQKIKSLDEELMNKFLTSEGRIISLEDGTEVLKPTSIKAEYEKIGIIITKNEYAGKTLDEIKENDKDAQEKYEAAIISYEVMPSSEKKKILDEIKKEKITSSYQLAMIKLLQEFYKECENYQEALNKRENILDLLKYRNKYLSEIGIRHGVDPFSRMKVEEQLKLLNEIGDNSLIITRLRKEIAALNEKVELLNNDNKELLVTLDKKAPRFSRKDPTNSKFETLLTLNDFTKTEVKKNTPPPNRVINITKMPDNFKRRKCKEVTSKVLERVSALFENKAPTNQNPELEIVASNEINDKVNSPLVEERNDIFETIEDKDLFQTKEEIENELSFPEIEPFDNEISSVDLFKNSEEDDLFNDIKPDEIVPETEVNNTQQTTSEVSNDVYDIPVSDESQTELKETNPNNEEEGINLLLEEILEEIDTPSKDNKQPTINKSNPIEEPENNQSIQNIELKPEETKKETSNELPQENANSKQSVDLSDNLFMDNIPFERPPLFLEKSENSNNTKTKENDGETIDLEPRNKSVNVSTVGVLNLNNPKQNDAFFEESEDSFWPVNLTETGEII